MLLTSFYSFFTRQHRFSTRAQMQAWEPSSLASDMVGDPYTPCIPRFVWEEISMCWGSCFCGGLDFMPSGTSSQVEQPHAVLSNCWLPSTCPAAQTAVQTIASVRCFCLLCSCLMVPLTLACRDIGQKCAGGADFALARFITLPTTKWHGRGETVHNNYRRQIDLISFKVKLHAR